MSTPRSRERYKPAHIPDDEWAQMQLDAAEKQAAIDAEHALCIARLLAVGADDGYGNCRWCSAPLVVGVDGKKMHPATACEGPPAVCVTCGTKYRASQCPKCIDERARLSGKAPPPPAEMQPVRQTKLFGYED